MNEMNSNIGLELSVWYIMKFGIRDHSGMGSANVYDISCIYISVIILGMGSANERSFWVWAGLMRDGVT